MKILLYVLLVFVSETIASDALPIQNPQSSKVFSWVDQSGNHKLSVTNNNSGTYFESNWKSELQVTKCDVKKEKCIERWKIKDFSSNPSQTINYISDSFEVIDVNNDGIKETSFFYIIDNDGLDPFELKFMLHNKDKKLAIRGKIPRVAASTADYHFSFDESFSTEDKDIILYSLSRWNKQVKKLLNESL